MLRDGDPATPRSPAHGAVTPGSRRRSHDGVKAPGGGRGRGAGRGGGRANRRPQSPRGREPGALCREPGAERAGLGPGRSGAEKERARPSPESAACPPAVAAAGPAAAAPAMEQDHSPRKIQFTVPLLEPHLDPEAAEQVRSGAGRQGTRPAEDEGPLDVAIPDPRSVLPQRCAPARASALFGGLLSPPPPWEPPLPVCASSRRTEGPAPALEAGPRETRSLPPHPWGRGPA